MSETPRTDAETKTHSVRTPSGELIAWSTPHVSADFARTLERELASAKKSARDNARNFRASEARRIELVRLVDAWRAVSSSDSSPCPDPIVESSVALLRARSEVGVRKYGTTLADSTADIVERIRHLKEELADALNYAVWAEDELTKK